MFLGLDNDDIVNLMEGFVLSIYQFKKYKSGMGKTNIKSHPYSQLVNDKLTKKDSKKTQKANKNKKKSLKGGNNQKRSKKQKIGKGQTNNTYVLHLCLMDGEVKKLQKMVEKMLVMTRSIHMCQDLLNEPGNKINPVSFVEFIKSYINLHKLPLKMKVINELELKKMGMNLLVSVGQGSIPEMRSRLVVLEYYGLNNNSESKGKNNKGQVDCVLIGKGVTQDTGGISIKPGASIPEMKTDKAGACIVFSLMSALSKLGSKKNIVALLPIAENSIGPEAIIPV